MSVYQKSSKCGRRKVSNASRSTSEEHSEEGSGKSEKVSKVPRSKYSKKTSMKRAFNSYKPGEVQACSFPSASEDEEQKEAPRAMLNFVKSPLRIPGLYRGPTINWRPTPPFTVEMISVPSCSDEAANIRALNNTPPKKLYSDVVRTEPRATAVLKEVAEEAIGVQDQDCAAAAEVTGVTAAPGTSDIDSEEEAADDEGSMVLEESTVDKDRLRAVGQQRQTFLNRSAQKLEQRKTCELAKRSTLGRNNKAREINSRNKRQRRSDMMQRHSGVNNNRKCC